MNTSQGVGVVVLLPAQLEELVTKAVDRALAKYQPAAVEPLMDRAECARYLGISIATLDKLVKDGMPHGLAGDAKRFVREDVARWIKERAK